MYSFPTSIAQEQAIENMVNSKHFGGFPYKVEDGGMSHGKHFVILSIELPNGTLVKRCSRPRLHERILPPIIFRPIIFRP